MATIIGLTGGIASGKSTVTKMFHDEGIPVIDTDQIAKDLLLPGTEVYKHVIKQFGDDIVLSDQSINRKMLGRLIFNNKSKRDRLNDIVHPGVYAIVDTMIARYEKMDEPFIVIDVPLLFETGYDKECDVTVVVYTSLEQQIERLMFRDNIDEAYAMAKIKSQMPLDEKKEKADYVIDNSLSILNTKRDFLTILQELR